MSNPNPKLENLKSYKPKWNLGKTKTIRVPIAIAEEVLKIAHQIDEGHSPDTSEYINNNGTASISDNEIKKLKQKISELEKQLISVTSDKNGVLSKDERAKPETHLNEKNITDTSESIDRNQAKAIISEGLSTRSSNSARIKNSLAQLGILLGFKIEKNSRKQWTITDTSESIHIKEAEFIISEGLLTRSNYGARIKNSLAQLGILLGFKIKKNSKNQWIITDTSD